MTDSGIRSDLQSFTADGTFSYSDALQLLNDVSARGAVTAQEFADLQTIAGHLESQSGIASPSYVASVFHQLADGSKANATWTGGSTGGSTPLGDLAAGTSQAQLNQLIGKWFLGTDMPDPTTTGASASEIIRPTYKPFTYPLFAGGTPQVNDISQGDIGDCELCAGLVALVEDNPAMIKSMIVDDGNGIYGIRFYVNGKETWVTVNDQLPVYQGGLIFNNAYAPDQTVGFWADLVEKGYAQLSATGNIDHPAVNSYQNISANLAFDILTNLTNASVVTYFMASADNFAGYKAAIIDAVNQHDDVILETDPNAADMTDSSGKKTLIGDHAYTVIGYDAATGDFIVRNPWGVEASGGPQTYEVQFEVSMADVVKINGDFVIDNVSAPNVAITSAANVAALASTTNASFYPATPHFSTNTSVSIAQQVQAFDTAGLAVSQYRLQLVGGVGNIQLNGAVNLASAAQAANGQVIVSAADFAKLTLATGATAGTVDLLIAGNDGTGWGGVSELQWTVSATPTSVLPAVHMLVAPSGTVSMSSLFQLAGAQADSYFIQVEFGGTINLNGATDQLGGGSGGQVKVSASDLGKLTFTASANSGIAIIDVTASVNGVSSSLSQIPVDVGYSVSAALHSFDQGQTPFQVSIADTGADVFGNLGHLEQMMPNWNLLGILLTDGATPTETISYPDLQNDKGLLSLIQGNYNLIVTGVPVAQEAAVRAQAHVGGIGISASASYVFGNLASLQSQVEGKQIVGIDAFDDGSQAGSFTISSAKAYGDLINATSGYEFTVSDSSANLLANLDSLESLAATGKISIALTDAGLPTLTVTTAQLAADGDVLKALAGYPVIDVAADASTHFISGVSGHATVVTFSGKESDYTISQSIAALSGATVTGGGITTSVHDVTALQFSDGEAFIASQTPSQAGGVSSAQVANLYAAVFARTPDAAGLNYYEVQAANNGGIPITTFAQWFLQSPEYTGNAAHNYAQSTAGETQFITDTYHNLLGRGPETGAVPYYLNVIGNFTNGLTPGTAAYAQADQLAHATVLAYFSQSGEFIGDVQVTSASPADSHHWLILV